MTKKTTKNATPVDRRPHEDDGNGESEFRVEDRRHWARADSDEDAASSGPEAEPARPTIVDEYRRRAEQAEAKLHEYIEAYKGFKDEQDRVRERLHRDVQRKVHLEFGGLVGELLETVDDLDLALAHAAGVPGAEALAQGVSIARDRFLAALERRGISPVTLDGETFDPNEAEAIRLDPVDDPARDGTVTETVRPGYRLGDLMIRPARVAVGRLDARSA